MPATKQILCALYAAIAAAALVATWSQNLAYFASPADFIAAAGAFLSDTRVNPAARSVGADIALVFLAASIFMLVEARKHGIRFVWAYILGGLFVAVSVTFPLFLLARELKSVEPAGALPASDAAGVAALTIFVGAIVLWILQLI